MSVVLTVLLPNYVDVGPVAEQQLDGGDLPVGGRPHHHGEAMDVRPVYVIARVSQPQGEVVLVEVSLSSALVHVNIADSRDVLCGHVAALEVGQDGAGLGSGGHGGAGGPERGHLVR